MMPFDMQEQQVANECLFETVSCPFSSVGCLERMMRKDMDDHEEAAMKQHNRLLLQNQVTRSADIQSLKVKKTAQAESILSLQRDTRTMEKKAREQDASIQTLRQNAREQAESILSLQRDTRTMELKALGQTASIQTLRQEVQSPLLQIVHRVQLAELFEDGKITKYSEYKMVGTHKTCMKVNKGYHDNDNCCGMYLSLKEGTFPCRVISTFEVVHWDGKPESARKIKDTDTYVHATSFL